MIVAKQEVFAKHSQAEQMLVPRKLLPAARDSSFYMDATRVRVKELLNNQLYEVTATCQAIILSKKN